MIINNHYLLARQLCEQAMPNVTELCDPVVINLISVHGWFSYILIQMTLIHCPYPSHMVPSQLFMLARTRTQTQTAMYFIHLCHPLNMVTGGVVSTDLY